jgi:hypothetical protein
MSRLSGLGGLVVLVYLATGAAMAAWIARRQRSRADYPLARRAMGVRAGHVASRQSAQCRESRRSARTAVASQGRRAGLRTRSIWRVQPAHRLHVRCCRAEGSP